MYIKVVTSVRIVETNTRGVSYNCGYKSEISLIPYLHTLFMDDLTNSTQEKIS